MTRRIGIFAGAFDPVHDGHIALAEDALEQLELDSVQFMVEGEPWGDKQPAAQKHREQMVKLAIAKESRMQLLHLEDSRFSIETSLPKIEKLLENDQLFFIFGADVFLKMNQEAWPQLEALLKHHIVVFERAHTNEEAIQNHAKQLGIVTAIVTSRHAHHTSTDVRLKPHESAVWVPTEVARFIKKHSLYGYSNSTP